MRRVSTSRVLLAAAYLPVASCALYGAVPVPVVFGVVVKSLSPASNVIYVCLKCCLGNE